MKVKDLFEAKPSSVQVKNLDGTYKRFTSLSAPGVDAWKNSHDKPSKNDLRKADREEDKKAEEKLLSDVARIVQREVAAVYPDADPMDFIWPKLKKLGVNENDMMKVVNRAVKTHLGAGSYNTYIKQFNSDAKDLG